MANEKKLRLYHFDVWTHDRIRLKCFARNKKEARKQMLKDIKEDNIMWEYAETVRTGAKYTGMELVDEKERNKHENFFVKR